MNNNMLHKVQYVNESSFRSVTPGYKILCLRVTLAHSLLIAILISVSVNNGGPVERKQMQKRTSICILIFVTWHVWYVVAFSNFALNSGLL